MPTVSLSALRNQAKGSMDQVTQAMQAKGYVLNPASNTFVRDPGFQIPQDAMYGDLRNAKLSQDLMKGNDESDPTLSVGDVASLNESGAQLPYGTTRSQAAAKNVVPKKARTANQNIEEKTYNAVKGFADKLLKSFNQKGDLKGVGFAGTGSLADFLFNAGLNKDTQGADNRIAIGNIKGALAKLRGGTSFTPNEEKLLKSYTPTVNDSPASIKRKLLGLQDYLKYRVSVADESAAPESAKTDNDPLGLFK